MIFDEICRVKEQYPECVVIVKDGNKVSLGWKEAEEFAATRQCSIGVIHSHERGKIPWVVRHDLNEVIVFFEKLGRKYIVVDGSGRRIFSEKPKREETKSNNKGAINHRASAAGRTKTPNIVSRKTRTKSKRVNDMSKTTIFDSWKESPSGGIKKANPVNTKVDTKNAEQKAKEVEKRRQMVDTSIHPNGVRYGDAYKFRKKSRRK